MAQRPAAPKQVDDWVTVDVDDWEDVADRPSPRFSSTGEDAAAKLVQEAKYPINRTNPKAGVTPSAVNRLRGGLAEGLEAGLSPVMHPITTAKEGVKSVVDAVKRIPEEARTGRLGLGSFPDYLLKEVVIKPALGVVKDLAGQAAEGDIAGATGKAAGIATGVYLTNRAVQSGVKTAVETKNYFKPPKVGYQHPVVPKPTQQFVDALDGGRKIYIEDRLRDAVNSSAEALTAAETQKLGRPVQNLRDARVVVQYAKEQAWAPYEQLMDATTGKITRANLIKAAKANIPDTIKGTRGSAAAKIENSFAKDLTKNDYTVKEIESAAQALNAELNGIYQKDGLSRAAAMKMPKYAGREAVLKAFRDLADNQIRTETGYNPTPYRKQYGNLKALEDVIQDRPGAGNDTMFESVAKFPAPQTPKGLGVRAVQYLMHKTPNQLIASAFKGFRAKSTPPSTALEVTPPPVEGELLRATGYSPSSPTVHPMRAPIRGLVTDSATPRLIPERAGTLVTPPPAEGAIDVLRRTQSPTSRLTREVTGAGPFTDEALTKKLNQKLGHGLTKAQAQTLSSKLGISLEQTKKLLESIGSKIRE